MSDQPLEADIGERIRARPDATELGLRHRLLILVRCRIEFHGEPKPVFGYQEPSVAIFRRSSISCLVKAILGELAVSLG
jgi:hypothetical protein